MLEIITLDEYRGQYKDNNELARDIKYFKQIPNEKLSKEMGKLLIDDLYNKHKEKLKKYHYVIPALAKSQKTQKRLNFAANYLADLTGKNYLSFDKAKKTNLKDQKIIILDDVIYTGSTLRKHTTYFYVDKMVTKICFATFGISDQYNDEATKNLIEVLKDSRLF